jgi:hypothetical protein
MTDVAYYVEWLSNCSKSIVPGVEPAILARTPWGEYSEMRRLYTSLLMEEKVRFVHAMKEITSSGDNVPIEAKIMIIESAWHMGIWDIEPEVRALDAALPQEPWDYDKVKPPPAEERLHINLRAVINEFLIICDRDRKVA